MKHLIIVLLIALSGGALGQNAKLLPGYAPGPFSQWLAESQRPRSLRDIIGANPCTIIPSANISRFDASAFCKWAGGIRNVLYPIYYPSFQCYSNKKHRRIRYTITEKNRE